MLHVNLPKWRNLIRSPSRDIGRYLITEISNSGYCGSVRDERLAPLIKTNKSWQKSVTLSICLIIRVLN